MATRKLRGNDAPQSEDTERQRLEYDEEACIHELQRIARAYPDRVITRNYFRVNSSISESTWNRFFGTFTEFKRQAGITPSRQVHALEKAIAKHAAADHYREMNKIRQDWGKRYRRHNATRFQTILSCSDLHDESVDRFYLRVLLDTAKRAQPDKIVLNGDVFDLPEFGKYTVDPRTWNPVRRIRFVHERILRPLRNACPDAEINFIEGNHELRLLRHLGDSTPALRAVLSDLHGMTIPGLLGLEEFELNYVAKADMAAFRQTDIKKEVGRNFLVLYGCFLAHHYPEGRFKGMPGISGHHHKWQVWSMHSEQLGPYQWMQLGAGHVRDAEYCDAEKWNMGFALHHVDVEKQLVNHEYISITDHAMVGGKLYTREARDAINGEGK